MLDIMNISVTFPKATFIKDVSTSLMELHVAEWVRCLNRVEGRTGVGRNKLRTYRTV